MTCKVYDLELERELIALRDARGGNRHDEVWDGVYVMSPLPNDEHQLLVSRLTRILDEVVFDPHLGQVRAGVNVSDRADHWHLNYRVPDVAVFLHSGAAKNCDSFWLGGPDLAIEIASPGESLAEKLNFYHVVGTQELLIIDRYPWSIQQWVWAESGLLLREQATSENRLCLQCQTVAINLTLLADSPRSKLLVSQRNAYRTWQI